MLELHTSKKTEQLALINLEIQNTPDTVTYGYPLVLLLGLCKLGIFL